MKREGEEIAATVDLAELFRRFENGVSVEFLMPSIAEAVQSSPEGFDPALLSDYEMVKENLIIRIGGCEKNREFLENVPWKQVEDLAVTCHVMFQHSDGELSTVIVDKTMLERFGVAEETLFNDAAVNSMKNLPPRIEPIRNAREYQKFLKDQEN